MGWRGKSARRLLLALALMILAAATGCLGEPENPSVFPYWLPAGPIIRTHAKPPGKGNFANFDPDAVRLEVRPLCSTNPVRSQHLVIATVLDEKGVARRKRRVEWMLEGAGNIVEVDERGYLAGRGYKVDNKYAVSYTDYFEHTFTRGNDDPNDDFVIQPGQTWCIISSAVEGDTQLTVYAPEIYDHDKRTVVVTTHWVDAQWQFPQSAAVRAGTVHTLSTNVYRHSDRSPLPNFRVRYTLLDGGPSAQLLPSQSNQVMITSDVNGNANTGMSQLSLQPGINRVGVEIFRPADPLNPNSPPVSVAKTETTIEWQAPQLSIRVDAPQAVVVGQEIPATFTVTNDSKVDTQVGDVSVEIPPGMSYVRATPEPASIRDGILTWQLAGLGGGRSQSISATFKAVQTGVFSTTALAKTDDGLKVQKAASFRVDTAQLQLSIDRTKTAMVGETISLPIVVANPGTGSAANLKLEVQMEDGLEVVVGNQAIRGKVVKDEPALEARETRTIPFRVTPRKAGPLQLAIFARADGGLQAQAACTITVQAAQVEIRRSGPESVFLSKEGNWSLNIRNAGQSALTNVVFRERLPVELTFRNASDGGVFNPTSGEIVWTLGKMNAGEERIVRYTALGNRLTTQGILSGLIQAYPSLEQKSENKIQVLGVPALRMEVSSDANPVEVGLRFAYTIRIINQGTLPANQIDVVATAPAPLQALAAYGPQNGQINGQNITYPTIPSLQPGQAVTLTVVVQGVKEGDARFHAEASVPTMPSKLIEEQATRIVPGMNRGQ